MSSYEDLTPEAQATIDPARAIRVKTSTGWANLVIQGPPGPTGSQGPQGIQGIQGPQGPAGPGVPTPVINGQWIKGVSGAAVWAPITVSDITIPRVRATRGSVFTVANSAWTTIPFDTEELDTDGMHDPAANPERLTCKTAGVYAWHFFIYIVLGAYAPWGTGFLSTNLVCSTSGGSTKAGGGGTYVPTIGGIGLTIESNGVANMVVGDYLSGQLYQNGTGTCQIQLSSHFAAWRIG